MDDVDKRGWTDTGPEGNGYNRLVNGPFHVLVPTSIVGPVLDNLNYIPDVPDDNTAPQVKRCPTCGGRVGWCLPRCPNTDTVAEPDQVCTRGQLQQKLCRWSSSDPSWCNEHGSYRRIPGYNAPSDVSTGSTPVTGSWNEDNLRADIIKVWGEYGAHIDVFDMIRRKIDSLEAWMRAIADLNSHVEPPFRMAERALRGEAAPDQDPDDGPAWSEGPWIDHDMSAKGDDQ